MKMCRLRDIDLCCQRRDLGRGTEFIDESQTLRASSTALEEFD